jgi:hypothetical protein
MAKRMAAYSPDLRARLAFGHLLATQHDASPATLDDLVSLHHDATADYTRNPGLAAKLATDPDSAALVLIANTLLNLDTALNR